MVIPENYFAEYDGLIILFIDSNISEDYIKARFSHNFIYSEDVKDMLFGEDERTYIIMDKNILPYTVTARPINGNKIIVFRRNNEILPTRLRYSSVLILNLKSDDTLGYDRVIKNRSNKTYLDFKYLIDVFNMKEHRKLTLNNILKRYE